MSELPEDKLEQEMATSTVTGSGMFKPDTEYMKKRGQCYLERTTLYAVLAEMRFLRAHIAQCESDLQVAAKHERLAVEGLKERLALAEGMAEAADVVIRIRECLCSGRSTISCPPKCSLCDLREALATWRRAK